MHYKNEVSKIIQEIVAGQGLEISFEIGHIHQLMDDYAEDQKSKEQYIPMQKCPKCDGHGIVSIRLQRN